MIEFVKQIIELAKLGKYSEIIELINNSEYTKEKKIYNIKKSVKKLLRMIKTGNYYFENKTYNFSDNIWQNYFECLKIGNLKDADKIIEEINAQINNPFSNFYLILTKDLLRVNEKNLMIHSKLEKIDNEILSLLHNEIIPLKKINILEILLASKINLKNENNMNYYVDYLTLNLILMIKQLKNNSSFSKNLFFQFEYEGNNLEKFYKSMENGDYLSAFKYIKTSEVYNELKNDYDKTYPLVLYKLLKTLKFNCNKKNISSQKFGGFENEQKELSEYEKLYTLVYKEEYLTALAMNLNKNLVDDLEDDIVKILSLKQNFLPYEFR